MKVMFVANKDITLYLFRRELIEKVISEEHDVIIVCPKGNKVDHFLSLGCSYVDLPIDRRGKNPLKELKSIFKINSLIKKNKPDIVLTYTIKPNLYVGLIRRFKKFRFIPTITGLGTAISTNDFLSQLLTWIYKLSFKKAYTVFFQNNSNLE